jgi:serine/threonine protein phosphatase 1
VNTTSVVFGDVHGESAKLRALIDTARGRWGDVKLYGVGDFIDRGPDSKGVVQICVDEGVEGILGNHELWFHQLLNKGVFDDGALHPVMGGRQTLDSYGLGIRHPEKNLPRVPESHREFVLPRTVTDDLLVKIVAEVKPDDFLWDHFNPKDPQIHRLSEGGVQIMGHTPLKAPIDGGHFIALDTGCGRKKKKPNCLSAVALHEDGTRTLFSSEE